MILSRCYYLASSNLIYFASYVGKMVHFICTPLFHFLNVIESKFFYWAHFFICVYLSFCSNIDSKSLNNTSLKIIEILFLLLLFLFPVLITSNVKFGSIIDLRKQDFLSAEEISELSRFVKKYVTHSWFNKNFTCYFHKWEKKTGHFKFLGFLSIKWRTRWLDSLKVFIFAIGN